MKKLLLLKPALPTTSLIHGLGWFSLALGMAELLAPRKVSRGAGIRKNDTLVRSYGLREIATGIGLLVSANPRPWLWGRVAGDVLDMATVGLTANPKKPARLGLATVALLGVGILDVYSALRSRPRTPRSRARTGPKDYGQRSGFPKPAEQMRGAALNRRNNGSRQRAAAE